MKVQYEYWAEKKRTKQDRRWKEKDVTRGKSERISLMMLEAV